MCSFAGWHTGIFITKPLLMTSLAAYFYSATMGLPDKFARFVFMALLFSWAGDCFLLFADGKPRFFLFGLGSFLVTHLFYITAFWKFPGREKGWAWQKKWPFVPVLFYLAAMLFYLWPDLTGAFKIPVGAYSFVICAMLLSAMNMRGRVAEKTAFSLMAGAGLFVLSDTLIAVGKFKSTGLSDAVFSVGIMVTYLVGQYLIVRGSVATK